jgi:predicted Fe-Mo cluster-binding NifX family protein
VILFFFLLAPNWLEQYQVESCKYFLEKITMRIAVITDDSKTFSEHFRCALFYLVFTVENGKITHQELRLKANDSQEQGNANSDLHDTGSHLAVMYTNMMGTIIDCEVLLARGMDKAVYEGLKIRGIRPIITVIQDVQAAMDAYLAGDIVDHSEGLH